MTGRTEGSCEPRRYEVTVGCSLSPVVEAALPDFSPTVASDDQVRMVGEVRDQAALSALVQRLSDLRIDLLELRVLDP